MIDFRAGTEPMDFVLNEEDLLYEEEILRQADFPEWCVTDPDYVAANTFSESFLVWLWMATARSSPSRAR